MTVGIIGAGLIGAAFARRLAQANLPAVLSNSRGPDSLVDLVADLPPRRPRQSTIDRSVCRPCAGRAGREGLQPSAGRGPRRRSTRRWWPPRAVLRGLGRVRQSRGGRTDRAAWLSWDRSRLGERGRSGDLHSWRRLDEPESDPARVSAYRRRGDLRWLVRHVGGQIGSTAGNGSS